MGNTWEAGTGEGGLSGGEPPEPRHRAGEVKAPGGSGRRKWAGRKERPEFEEPEVALLCTRSDAPAGADLNRLLAHFRPGRFSGGLSEPPPLSVAAQ